MPQFQGEAAGTPFHFELESLGNKDIITQWWKKQQQKRNLQNNIIISIIIKTNIFFQVSIETKQKVNSLKSRFLTKRSREPRTHTQSDL